MNERELMEAYGYEVDTTPVDTLMSSVGLGLSVAWAMEHPDEEPPQ